LIMITLFELIYIMISPHLQSNEQDQGQGGAAAFAS